MSGDFTPEQKRYLEGFTSGLQIARAGRAAGGAAGAAEPSGPDAEHIARAGPHASRPAASSTTRRSSSASSIRSTPMAG